MGKDYKNLKVWQEAMELVKLVYLETRKLPKYELYALGDQLRRAAVSVPSNIAEGQRKNSRMEFVRFINIAVGSLAELETQVILVRELYGLEINGVLEKIELVFKLLFGLRKGLKLKDN